ncbi:MAG: hypothetical protein CSA65_02435 [Proteobacteria bacterium]|nr:MAG: hypothetical protein CSA65_02435 [Pseudomonadota bacterium]
MVVAGCVRFAPNHGSVGRDSAGDVIANGRDAGADDGIPADVLRSKLADLGDSQTEDLPTPDLLVGDLNAAAADGRDDLAAPDVLAPDVLAPDVLAPDVLAPDVLAPDVLAPDVLAPDVLAPDVLAPDVLAPDVKNCLSFEICNGIDDDCDQSVDNDCVAPWWNSAFPRRRRLVLTNTTSETFLAEPLFLDAATIGFSGAKESSVRVVRWSGGVAAEIPFALHDWDQDGLGDSDDVVDADDELLLLVDIPANARAEYYIYYDTSSHSAVSHPKVTVELGGAGSGFPRVSVDGAAPSSARHLRFLDGGKAVYQLMLEDSIPFWNQSSTYTFESSAIGPRINALSLPDGRVVYPTVNHTTGQGIGPLAHTIRLGPLRLDGNFSWFSQQQAFFQPRLISAAAHSAVRAFSRPIAAVTVIDAEFYCDEPNKCSPAKDYGDVRLVGYLFDRGNQNEVLMRWRVTAKMNGSNTISATTKAAESEYFSLASYLLEGYTEAQFGSLIDIDTTTVKNKNGATFSASYDTSQKDDRRCVDTDSWILMSDTDSPQTGVVALLPEGLPRLNGNTASSWRGCWWADGQNALGEPNGFQCEWHLSASAFANWGSGANDTTDYRYWIYAYQPSANNQKLANQRARRIAKPPTIQSTFERCSDFPGC